MSDIESQARLLCKADGGDPDSECEGIYNARVAPGQTALRSFTFPAWHRYRVQAYRLMAMKREDCG